MGLWFPGGALGALAFPRQLAEVGPAMVAGALVAGVLVLFGCSGETETPPEVLSGDYEGAVSLRGDLLIFELRLRKGKSGPTEVGGEGVVIARNRSREVGVKGSYRAPEFELEIEGVAGEIEFLVVGEVENGGERLDAEFKNGQPITFYRRR